MIARWPREEPLVALISGGGAPRSRWSILARPSPGFITPALADAATLERDLARLEPSFRGVGPGGGWLGGEAGDDAPPMTSGWIGWISYGVGEVLEPAAGPTRRSDWPLMVWHRVEGALTHDSTSGRWRTVGRIDPVRLAPPPPDDQPNPPTLEPSVVGLAPDRYQAMVARGIEYVRAGDVYQVNLAHTLDGRVAGGPRAFASAMLARAAPWFGAYIEHVGPDGRPRAVCSASPESLAEIEPVRAGADGRRVVSRPMKGTLAGSEDPGRLRASSKDRAELDMIVDLMRNDLGRVGALGSVRVDDRQALERHGFSDSPAHPGVWQGVATVSATLRPGVCLADLLRAIFPAGSVTGAPKVRAMQIIEELEGRPRGPYCGCVGYIGDDGRVALNVAIRTAMLEQDDGGRWLAAYPVGAGIVADSDPAREWAETMHKAQVFLGLTGAQGSRAGGYVISDAE